MGDQQAPREGLVGCGFHGNALAQAIVRTDSLRLVACADPDTSAAARAAALADEVSTHDTVDLLLAESDVHAVIIATPLVSDQRTVAGPPMLRPVGGRFCT